jgi:hypothetical protein
MVVANTGQAREHAALIRVRGKEEPLPSDETVDSHCPTKRVEVFETR